MANLFTIIKTFRPYRKILSADFNTSLLTLKASFDKLGTAPPDGKTGVSTPFWVGTATEDNHAASKGALDILDAATTATLDTDRAATATTLSDANAAQVAQIAALDASIQADVAATAADRTAIAASLAAVDSFPALASQVASDATQTAASAAAALISENNAAIYSVFNKLDATSNPTANDDGANTSTNGVFVLGSNWVNATLDTAYICLDASAGAAVWSLLTAPDVTLGTLTKTFATNEAATMTLSTAVTAGAPVVSVIKEVTQVGVTNNNWDAAAGSYTLEDSAPATTLSFVGDLATAAYSQNFSVSAQDAAPQDVTFNPDGTKMYVVGNDGDDVNEYALSTGFDVSTASYTQAFSVSAQDTSPEAVAFNVAGTKMFVLGLDGQDVNEYALSTGFDVSTASYTQNFSVSAQEGSPKSIAFNTAGTKMYVLGNLGVEVNEYALATGFDVSTASYTQNFSVSSQETNPMGLAFNSDGTKMYVCGSTGQDVNEYTLSTGFDISTASYAQNFSVASQDTSPTGIAFNTNGGKMFIAGATGDDVNEYTLSFSLALGTGSFASTDVGKTIEVNSGALVLKATTGTYSETTAPSSTTTAAAGDWSMNAVVYDADADVLETSNYVGGFDLAVAAYDSVSFSVASQDALPRGLAFNTDGTKMFVVGSVGQDVNEYTLSTGFDVSTSVFVDAFSVTSQDTAPRGLAFNTDGTKLFVVGAAGQDVNEYTLTSFDISSATFVDSFSVSGQDTGPSGIAFNTDGTKMFVVGTTGLDVNEYTLSTGFDVSTSVFVDAFSISGQDGDPSALTFSTDGTKMFVAGGVGDDINEYTLSTGFDVSTASFVDSFSVSSQEVQPAGLAFSTDGTKMYVVGASNDTVYQYTTGVSSIPTGYQPCISSNIDSTYWTDINALTATNVVGNGNVFYAVSNDSKTTWSVLDNSNGVRSIARVSGGTWQYNSNTAYGSETWVAASTNTEVQALRDSMAQETGFQLSSAAYVQGFSVAAQDAQPYGVAFNADGTKMFVVGDIGTDINEYNLSTGFDVSTASYSQNFSVAAQDSVPYGMAFNTDGTKMYVVGLIGKKVNEYNLSTGFDVSTASFTQNFSVASEGTPFGLAFSPNGTQMFVVVKASSTVNQYTLTTGFDISTASFTRGLVVSSQETEPQSVAFNTDGTEMFLIGTQNDSVMNYSLSSGFDISTAAYTSEFSVAAQETQPTGLVFNPEGEKMFVIGQGSDTVHQYSTSALVAIASNQMNSTTLNAITDANQITLGTDLDFAAILYMGAGSTVPTYSGTAMNYDANVINNGAVLGTDYNWDFPATDKVRITALADNNLKVRIV